MAQFAYSFSREDLELLAGSDFRECAQDDAFVDGIRFDIGQADKGSQYTPIQFGPRVPHIVNTLRLMASSYGLEPRIAGLAGDLADKLGRQP
jgi:hypothetical protein